MLPWRMFLTRVSDVIVDCLLLFLRRLSLTTVVGVISVTMENVPHQGF